MVAFSGLYVLLSWTFAIYYNFSPREVLMLLSFQLFILCIFGLMDLVDTHNKLLKEMVGLKNK